MKKYKITEARNNIVLIRKAQKGDKDAQEAICLGNKALILHTINVLKLNDNPSMMDDLVQEGFLGILRAIDNYKEESAAFGSYAYHWIKCSLIRAYEELKIPVKIPHYIREISRRENKVKERFLAQNGEEISDEELKRLIPELMEQRNEDAISVIRNGYAVSLDAPLPNDEGESLLSFQASSSNIEDEVDKKLFLEEVLETISRVLGEREKDIVLRRYGFYGEVETLESIGERYGITRERVRQLEKESLSILEESFTTKIGEYFR